MANPDRRASKQRAAARRALGERIHLLRRRAGLDQAELADRLGVSQAAVSTWELGKSEPGLLDIAPLCGVLECSYPVLVGDEPLPPPRRAT